MLLAIITGCDSPSVRCSGAQNLEEEHKELLACAGWLEYVEEHVCQIDYVPVIRSEPTDFQVFGRSNCLTGTITVATLDTQGASPTPRPFPIEVIIRTIVHEASHLADECAPGEEEAFRTEEVFLEDLCLNLQDRNCPLRGVQNLGGESYVSSCSN